MKWRSLRGAAVVLGLSAALVGAVSFLVGMLSARALAREILAASTPREVAATLVDHDLKALDGKARERAFDALRELAGKDDYWRDGLGSPDHLYRWEDGPVRWVLVATFEGMMVPGFSFIGIHQFDAGWKQLSVVGFSTGYRIALFDVWLEEVEEAGGRLLVARLGSIGSFGDYSTRLRQYYALRGMRPMLVRIEREGEGLVSGIFSTRQPMTGPEIPERSVDEWIRSLDADDPALVLETLVWLGGQHMRSAEPRDEDVNQESVEHSRSFEAVRADPRTASKLKELSRSANAWIRDAARFAMSRH